MSAEEGHSGNSSLLESCSEPEFQCHRNLGGFNTWLWVCCHCSLLKWVKKLWIFPWIQNHMLYSLRNPSAAVCLVLSQLPGLLTALRPVPWGWCCLATMCFSKMCLSRGRDTPNKYSTQEAEMFALSSAETCWYRQGGGLTKPGSHGWAQISSCWTLVPPSSPGCLLAEAELRSHPDCQQSPL